METVSANCSEILNNNRLDFSKSNLSLLYSCIDLTNLNSYATQEQIEALCKKAMVSSFKGVEIPTVAAVCIYPVYVSLCKSLLEDSNVEIATVSAGFPSAQTYKDVKYLETELALSNGATEIDIVLNLSAFFNKNESLVFDEIKTIKQLCGDKHLKVIIESDLLKEKTYVEQASLISLEAGADFIKTSTGKDGSVASLEAVYIMSKILKGHYNKTGKKVGLKPAGGISSAEDAVNYLSIVSNILGSEWMTPKLFRLGASRLAGNLLEAIVIS